MIPLMDMTNATPRTTVVATTSSKQRVDDESSPLVESCCHHNHINNPHKSERRKKADKKSKLCRKTQVQKKCVRFNETGNQYYSEKARGSVQECKNTWYTKQDYEQIRLNVTSALARARRTMLDEERFNEQSSFSRTMISLVKLVTDVDFVLDDASVLLVHSQEVEHNLFSRLFKAHRMEWLGLELYLVQSYSVESKHRRASIQSVVYDVQMEYRQGLYKNAAEADIEFRDSSRNFSQAMVLMSQLMAKASFAATMQPQTP
ncbi:hypothetical protein ACA910_009559 [Epithemia clementina (nom. ined.)]